MIQECTKCGSREFSVIIQEHGMITVECRCCLQPILKISGSTVIDKTFKNTTGFKHDAEYDKFFV